MHDQTNPLVVAADQWNQLEAKNGKPINCFNVCCHRNSVRGWQEFTIAQILGPVWAPTFAPKAFELLKQCNSQRARPSSFFLRHAHGGQMEKDDPPWSMLDSKNFFLLLGVLIISVLDDKLRSFPCFSKQSFYGIHLLPYPLYCTGVDNII